MAQKPKPSPKPKSAAATTPASPAKAQASGNSAQSPKEGRPAPSGPPHDAAFVEKQRKVLLDLRDHFLDQMQSVSQDSLRSRAENNEASAVGQHQADAGSDAYEKDFALSILSQEQDVLYEIDEALKRIEVGTYGICEMTGKTIPPARLDARPFARFTVECQQQLEKENRGRRRWETTPQFMDSVDNFADEEDDSSEDDDRKKEL